MTTTLKMEAAVLGAALQEAFGLQTVLRLLQRNADMFQHPPHQVVYQAICNLADQGEQVDMLTVVVQLRKMGKLQAVGGEAGVCELTANISSAAHIETHCRHLQEHYLRRRLLAASQQVRSRALDEGKDVFDLIAATRQVADELSNLFTEKRPRYIGELLTAECRRIVDQAARPRGLSGVPTGLTALDNVTGGWQKSDLIILAARPGVGKTSFLLAVGKYAAVTGKKGVIFSMEVSAEQLVRKLIANETGYNTSQLTRGLFDAGVEEAHSAVTKAEALRSVGLLLDDSVNPTLSALRAKAIQLKAQENIEWIGIDYLQLMQGDKVGSKYTNREQEVSAISRGLKQLAKELDLPVIALSQLSRELEKRHKKRPQLSDLRESGALEQDADLVLFLYRPECYDIADDGAGNSTTDVTEILIAKHRNGGTKDVAVRSLLGCGQYRDLTEPAWEQEAQLTPPF